MVINRKNDYLFKRIFGKEDTKDVLADFLTAVLDMPIKPSELVLTHTEQSRDYIDDKDTILDIQVRRKGDPEEKINIEIQQVNSGNINKRILYYWSKAFTEELKESQPYETLPRQISILIMDFDLFKWKEKTKFHGVFHISEDSMRTVFTDALEIHTIELPKLQKLKIDTNALNLLECWALYINNLGGETMEQIAKKVPMIKKAITVEQAFMKMAEERYEYEMREKARRDRENGLYHARKEGVTQVALKMLARNMKLDDISDLTGLSIKEIKKLK